MPDGSEIRDPETALTNFSVGPNCFPYGSFDTCTSTSTVQPCAESSCTPAGTATHKGDQCARCVIVNKYL